MTLRAYGLAGVVLLSCLMVLVAPSPARAVRAVRSPTAGASAGWFSPTSLPEPRESVAATVGHEGNIYVFGGTDGVTDFNTVFIYHPRANSWSVGATMPFGVEGAVAVTLPDGRIMVMGGGAGCHYTQHCTTYNTVEVYDPRSHAWTLLAPMHAPHYRGAAVLGPDGRVYIIGGWNGTAALATVEAYNTRTNTWAIVVSLPQAEEGVAAVVTRHRIAVVGGFDGGNAYYNNLFVYNGKTWQSGSPMPTARANLGAVVGPRGLIFALGGYAPGTYLATVEAYDPRTDSWAGKAPLPRALETIGAVTTANGWIYAIGGWYGSASRMVAVYGPRPARHNPFAG